MNLIKIGLLECGKKQVDLLSELHKRGFPGLQASQLSSYIGGRIPSPQARAVLKLTDIILEEWKAEK